MFLYSSYGLDDEKFENEHLMSNISDIQQVCFHHGPGYYVSIKSRYLTSIFYFCCALLSKIARAVYDVEEATSTAFEIIFSHKVILSRLCPPLIGFLPFILHSPFIFSNITVMQMIKAETRASFIKFLQILVAHHPSKR